MKSSKIRIIGGKWRGRLLTVAPLPGLRPTPDRVRETLFNWLAPYIVDANCLDLFAGTGALGFEALSRGAKQVTFVDSHPEAIVAIKTVAQTLGALPCMSIHCKQALSFLQQHHHQGPVQDIIFLDPPFASSLLSEAIALLVDNALLGPYTLLYAEAPRLLTAENLPKGWQILKHKMAGEVAYHLIRASE